MYGPKCRPSKDASTETWHEQAQLYKRAEALANSLSTTPSDAILVLAQRSGINLKKHGGNLSPEKLKEYANSISRPGNRYCSSNRASGTKLTWQTRETETKEKLQGQSSGRRG